MKSTAQWERHPSSPWKNIRLRRQYVCNVIYAKNKMCIHTSTLWKKYVPVNSYGFRFGLWYTVLIYLHQLAIFCFFHVVSNFNTLKILTLLVWSGLFWCFHKRHNPPNSDMDHRIFNMLCAEVCYCWFVSVPETETTDGGDKMSWIQRGRERGTLCKHFHSGKVPLLAFQDLSAAVDAMAHAILLTCLECTFGIHSPFLVQVRSIQQVPNGVWFCPGACILHPLYYSSGLCHQLS